MIALVAAWFWVGYSMSSWGWCLVEGYDVPLMAWIDPFHPYEWPPDGNPGFVRKGQIFPGGAPGTASTTTTASSGTSSGGGSGKGSGAGVGTNPRNGRQAGL